MIAAHPGSIGGQARRLCRLALGGSSSIWTKSDFLAEGLAYALVEMALQLLAILVLPILFFFLSLRDFGVITWALVISQITIALSTMGLDFSLMRLYFQWPAEERGAVVSLIARLAGWWSLALALAAYVILVLAFPISGSFWPLVLGAWAGLCLGLRNIPLSVLRVTGALRQYARFMLAGGAVQTATQIALVSAGFGPTGYMAGYAAGAVVSGALAARAIRRSDELAGQHLPPGLFSFTARVFPSLCFNRLLVVADRVVLFNWHDLSTLGLYGAASRFTVPIKFLSGGLKMAMVPAMSRAEAEDGDQARVFAAVSRLMVVAMLFVGSVLALGAWFVHFTPWGDQWVELQRLVGLLLAAHLLGGLAFVGQVGLYYSSRPQAATLVGGTNAVVLVGGLLLLTPALGGRGAALAAVLAGAASVGMVAVLFVRMTGRVSPWQQLIGLTASFAPAIAGAWLLGRAAQLVVISLMIALYGFATLLLVRQLRDPAMEASKP